MSGKVFKKVLKVKKVKCKYLVKMLFVMISCKIPKTEKYVDF